MDYKGFSDDEKTVSACAFVISQIGEYASRFNENERKKFPQLPWKEIRAMRNVIVHDYDNVNVKILWDTIKNDLPELANDIKKIIKNLS